MPTNQLDTAARISSKLKSYQKLSASLQGKSLHTSGKAVALGAAFLGGAATAHAGIIYSGTQNVSCNIAVNSNRCYANINMAGGNDLELHRNVVGGNPFIQIDEVPGGGFEINGFLAQVASGYVYPYALAAGVVVGPAGPWGFQAGQGNTLSEGNNVYPNDKWTALPNNTTRFVGLRATISGLTRYGWIRIRKNSLGNLTLVDWAYETTGASITTGTTVGTLPVDLVSFSVTELNKTAQLEWATATEQNNAGFDIERSEDGTTFRSIGWVPGKGNSSDRQEYVYDDRNLRSGKSYFYRLRQVDIDGQFRYSPVKKIAVTSDESLLGELFPNPTKDGRVKLQFTASESGTWTAQVFDASGKSYAIRQLNVFKGTNTLSLDFGKLAAGLYYVKFESNSNRVYRTLLVAD